MVFRAPGFPRRTARPAPSRRKVSDDWIIALPKEKAEVFEAVVRRWECAYAMMSVALDNSFSLRSRGELVCARQQLSVTSDLFEKLARSLTSFCMTLMVHGRGVTKLPVVEPLNARFFRGDTGQSAASRNGILHHLLPHDRSRFFHKVRILSDTLKELERQFLEAAEDISKGLATQPTDLWTKLDTLHYDFNTCLRETEVVWKSFLGSLPAELLPTLAVALDAATSAQHVSVEPHLSNAPA